MFNSNSLTAVTLYSPRRRALAADLSAGITLQTELVRHLATTLPSLAVQTGRLRKDRPGHGLGIPVDLCALRTPVIFIDMRKRLPLKASDRNDMIQKAKDCHDKFRKDMVRHMPTLLRSTNVSPLTHSLADAVCRGGNRPHSILQRQSGGGRPSDIRDLVVPRYSLL